MSNIDFSEQKNKEKLETFLHNTPLCKQFVKKPVLNVGRSDVYNNELWPNPGGKKDILNKNVFI